jgi:hypothetical protein
MSITALLIALIYIAIVCVIVWGVLAILRAVGVAIPAPVTTVAYAILAVICLLILLGVVTGNPVVLR